jgi:gp32 DNA binding protein like
MTDFKKLKQQSGKNSLKALTEEISKFSSNQSAQKDTDDRLWYPNVDKAGNGYAVVRFLPARGENEDVPFVRIYSHGFQGPSGSWYIENSLTTIGKQDPVSEYNSNLWNSGIEANKEIARKQKRKLTFISNVYVITDQQNPENEGKVFLFKYGKKIFDKLKEAMEPEFSDEEPMNPFDMWNGASFKIKIRNIEGYRNYDKSEFGKVEPLFADDSKIEEVFNQCHPLKPFIAPDQFKSYDVLKEKLNRVLGVNMAMAQNRTSVTEDEEEQEMPPQRTKAAKAPAVQEDDDDESLEFFKKLASN